MRPIPFALRLKLSTDPFMRTCLYSQFKNSENGGCCGGVEFHHAFIYAGRQINESWAIMPLCKFHHDNLDNDWVRLIALKRANLKEIKQKYPKFNWQQLNKYLEATCG